MELNVLGPGCARCHHHKFDPVTSEDYYGLFGYFNSTLYPHAGTEHQKERADFVSMTIPESLKDIYDSPEAWAVSTKTKGVGDVRINIAGDPRKKGEVAPRAFLSAITSDQPKIPDGNSGRLQLAEWIASPENPLTPRVIVNRIWSSSNSRSLGKSRGALSISSNSTTRGSCLGSSTASTIARP